MSIRLLTLYLDVLHDIKFLAHDCLVLTEEIHFRYWESGLSKGGHDLVLYIDLPKGNHEEKLVSPSGIDAFSFFILLLHTIIFQMVKLRNNGRKEAKIKQIYKAFSTI